MRTLACMLTDACESISVWCTIRSPMPPRRVGESCKPRGPTQEASRGLQPCCRLEAAGILANLSSSTPACRPPSILVSSGGADHLIAAFVGRPPPTPPAMRTMYCLETQQSRQTSSNSVDVCVSSAVDRAFSFRIAASAAVL